MDCVHELIALSFDAVILGLCIKEYYSCKAIANSLKVKFCIFLFFSNFLTISQAAPHVNIDDSLKGKLQSSSDKKIPYAVIRGTVTPIGIPLKSAMTPNVTGVLQIMKLK